ncbi:asparagine synthase (glutamine-hydrolyzing) [Clostridium tertium]|uniref:asparagine synthase (glutamine-hydrolyzing) n=1 Tax=Clostridium tertium TaxID=1559 RepID=UPI0023B33E2E|nr:asparagine synthase (glutamine-hydrolyzing) [Clostridium tertium]
MCGITGFVNFKENIKENIGTLKAMTDTLIHRGPNAEGTYISNNIMFGHRRLIVVDPEGGKQPMKKVVNGKEYVLVYNGELYNTEDLRKELINDGYIFEGYSDTEVLLTSYIRWGLDCIKKFNGIFAFAIYDENEKRVVLARDVMGVKPLFYTMKNGTFIFGSEIKALFKHPYVEPVVDKDGLTELFALGPAVIPGTTVYKNIEEVKPAQYIIVNEDGIKKDVYWELKAEEFNESEEEAVEHVRSLLIDSIDRQLVGDVPLCTFLSGGLDSSAISAIAAKEYKKRNKTLTTYSIDYEDNEKYFKSSLFQPTSDQHFAEVMAEYIGSDHRTVVLNHRDLVNALDDAVFGRDLPGMADVDSSLYLFCKEVKKDFVIALSGECADELFGGYPWFTNEEMINSNTFPWSRFIGERKAILSPDLKNLKIEEVAQTAYNDTLKEVPHLSGESKLEHRMRELFYLNLRWFMVNLLNRKDRMSMANSLEVRVPFADYRLVEYAFNIPSNIKLLEGREKGLLRKSLEGILPESIIYRKKSPYPKTHNPIYTEMVCNKMTKILNDKSSPILDIIDKTKVKEIVDTQGSSYKTPWYGQLMTGPQMIAYLIQVNNWLKSYNVKLM